MMSTHKLLSGEEIVAKGATKANTSLPEIGLKDVTPNGSWLEQKQIQSALDARKQLIEVERIEKWGTISHAEWREELMLAEVTKQSGGSWQFIGHHSEKKLYLWPEEALFLMEVNCLQLKYNNVTVPLQQAYSLLLRGQVSIMQYKVYASLSRLGYKVFRFSEPKTGDKKNPDSSLQEVGTPNSVKRDNNKFNCSELLEGEQNNTAIIETSKTEDMEVDKKAQNISKDGENIEIVCGNQQNYVELGMETISIKSEEVIVDNDVDEKIRKTNTKSNVTIIGDSALESGDLNKVPDVSVPSAEEDRNKSMEVINEEFSQEITETDSIPSSSAVNNKDLNRSHKVKILSRRHLRSHSVNDFHKYFENIPDLLHKDSVTVVVPTTNLPDHVTPRYTSYEINLKTLSTRKAYSPQHETNTYNTTNTNTYNTNERGTEYRFESTFSTHQGHNNQTFFYTNVRFHRPPPVFNQFHFWRPRPQWNYMPYNLFFQRPFIRNTFFAPRFHFFPRQPIYARPNFSATSNVTINENSNATTSAPIDSRKRPRDREQKLRFSTIKNLACKLKIKRLQGINNIGLENFVQNLIEIYNQRYRTGVHLTNDFEIVENENIVDTITLDDDEVETKKPRLEENSKFEENFNKIQQLAFKLKELEAKDSATARHRRALSSVVKTFNESFNADIYINESYDVVNRRQIVLDSSSDSDCVVKQAEEKQSKKERRRKKAGKKLRNPFNLLKTLAEKNKQVASCSKHNEVEEISGEDGVIVPEKEYSEEMKRTFKSWLPKSNDFGRAEIAPKSLMLPRMIESNKQEFLFDFIKNQSCKFINWLDVKISFLENMEYAAALFHDEHVMESSSDWNSLIKPEDCKDMPSVLSKLSIIPNNKDINEETSLRIDFDVYNRDVQNFKKRKMPKPHFRIICVNQSSELPPGPDVAALHTRYGDIPFVFAVVGESVSYLQIKPVNLAVYIPEGDTV